MAGSWNRGAFGAAVWAKQVLASRGLTEPVAKNVWQQANVNQGPLVWALSGHRLIPAAADLLECQPQMNVPLGLSADIANRNRSLRLAAIPLLSTAAQVQLTLSNAGIDTIFIKGPFQSFQQTGDFTSRGAGDVDVLVDAEVAEGAIASLREAGCLFHEPGVADYLAPRLVDVTHAASLSLSGLAIDLHRRLDPDPERMTVPFDVLLGRSDTIKPGGVAFRTLDPVDSCVLIASHGARDNWSQLRGIVDFVIAASGESLTIDPESLLDRASEFGVRRRMQLAIEVSRTLVPEWPSQSRRSRAMARWAWKRIRAGRLTRSSGRPRDVVGTYAFWVASEGEAASLRYGVKRLVWLPSGMVGVNLPRGVQWAYPALAPALVVARVVQRASHGDN